MWVALVATGNTQLYDAYLGIVTGSEPFSMATTNQSPLDNLKRTCSLVLISS